jgi:hypothetical protein
MKEDIEMKEDNEKKDVKKRRYCNERVSDFVRIFLR